MELKTGILNKNSKILLSFLHQCIKELISGKNENDFDNRLPLSSFVIYVCYTRAKNTLADKIKRKFRILPCEMLVFYVHFEQHFFRISVKFLHWPRANDESYYLLKYRLLVSRVHHVIRIWKCKFSSSSLFYFAWINNKVLSSVKISP